MGDDVLVVFNDRLRLLAKFIESNLEVGRTLNTRPCTTENNGYKYLIVRILYLFKLVLKENRAGENDGVAVLLTSNKHRPLGAEADTQRHCQLLTNRIARRMSHLRKQLLEIGV